MFSIVKTHKFIFLLWFALLLFAPQTVLSNEKFLIAIDIGHTKENFGALSARGVTEYEFNRAIAKVLYEKILESKNLHAFIINSSGKNISLKRRTRLAKEKGADLFLSLHHDSVQERYIKTWKYKKKKHFYCDNFSGYSIFISMKNKDNLVKSYKFASLLGEQLRLGGFTPTLYHAENIKGENRRLLDPNKGIYAFDDLIVLKTADMPAVLLECGFIVNRQDELLLRSHSYQEKMAKYIFDAIENYSKEK